MRKFDATGSLFPAAAAGGGTAQTTTGGGGGTKPLRDMLLHRSSDLARVMAEQRESLSGDNDNDVNASTHTSQVHSTHDATHDSSTLEEVVSDSNVSSARSSDAGISNVSEAGSNNSSDLTITTQETTAAGPYATIATTHNNSSSDNVATMDIAQVRRRLAAFENASGPTQAEIDAIIGQFSDDDDDDEDSDAVSADASDSVSRSASRSRARSRAATAVNADMAATSSDDSTHSNSSDDERKETVLLKVLVVGNARCGKTSVIRRFVTRDFSNVYTSTIGADYVEKRIAYDAHLNVCLQLWDIAGQDRFAKLTRAYFRDANGALIVCDITREHTVDAVANWKHELDVCSTIPTRTSSTNTTDDASSKHAAMPVVLVANKSDLLTDVDTALTIGVNMQKCVMHNNILEWFRTSAKHGDAIDDAFQCLLDRMVATHRAEAQAAVEAAKTRRQSRESVATVDTRASVGRSGDAPTAATASPHGITHDEHTTTRSRCDSVIRLTSLPPPLSYDTNGGFGCACN